ncbi:MAG: hypothetical protein Q9M91_03185 [Candidatus Dojkabacteria bacterium]|nr:hypothetical protein [Candidatus Dojkabacteria bacterium]MDQ7020827.1 hypothetical protein [Candidatus Dojkabacteria bacterium]
MEINFSNSKIDKKDLDEMLDSSISYTTYLKGVIEKSDYEVAEASINLPFSKKIIREIEDLVSHVDVSKLEIIFVVGIGGSDLGTKAIYDGLKGYLDEYKSKYPQIIFLDTINEEIIEEINDLIIKEGRISSLEEILINVISKSGTTTETIFNFELLYKTLSQLGEKINDRVIVTTDKNSKLWKKADELDIRKVAIPRMVGGRFSVFTAVGLLPLYLVDINISELLQGARKAVNDIIDSNDNNAIFSAFSIYKHYLNGKNIINHFFFIPKLERLGKWYKQLIGESIGKQYNLSGYEKHVGITPITSIGSTDLHSMAQLYFGGPNDKFSCLIYRDDTEKDIKNGSPIFENLVEGIKGKTSSDVMNAIYQGVKKAYIKNSIPFMEIIMPKLDAYNIGYFLQFKMLEVMYLGKLLNVNTFDQPNVEDYKKETRNLLEKK